MMNETPYSGVSFFVPGSDWCTVSPDSVKAVGDALRNAAPEELRRLIRRFEADDRPGVRSLVASAQRRLRSHEDEDRRIEALYAFEDRLRDEGLMLVCGVDEVGRGALAGPLTAGACILPRVPRILGLDDSKRLTPLQREGLAARVKDVAVSVSVAHVPAESVDALGVTAALRRAMTEAIRGLSHIPDHVVVDGQPLHLGMGESTVVKGDSSVASISAASIVAKVERDRLMAGHAESYPEFEFHKNKGYGAAEHIEAIRTLGLCDLHRRSFCRNFTDATLF